MASQPSSDLSADVYRDQDGTELVAVPMVAALSEAFRQTISKAGLVAYGIGLSDMSKETISKACRRAMLECKFMPTISELRDLCGGSTGRVRAEVAWSFVAQSVERVGYYRTPVFDDPVIAFVVQSLGGWMALCEQDAEQFDQHTRREFLKSYEALARSGSVPRVSLVGFYESSNHPRGFDVDTRVMIATGYVDQDTLLLPAAPPAVTIESTGLKSLANNQYAITDGGVG